MQTQMKCVVILGIYILYYNNITVNWISFNDTFHNITSLELCNIYLLTIIQYFV